MNWDWLQWRGCELSVYADLSKQMLIESSAAGCVERFLYDDVSSWISGEQWVLGATVMITAPCAGVNVFALADCLSRLEQWTSAFLWIPCVGRGVGAGGIRL